MGHEIVQRSKILFGRQAAVCVLLRRRVSFHVLAIRTPLDKSEGGISLTIRNTSTGHGQHGDYLFGWKGDALQRGMDALGKNGCSNDVCSTALKIQSGKDAIACTKSTQVNENVGIKGECKMTLRLLFIATTPFPD